MSSIENPYYGQIRTDLLKLLPQDIKIEKSLDVGCGLGKTSAYLKSKYKIKETVGIEYVPEIAQAAKANIDRVYSLSVDQDELPFSKDEFDLILLADILEHLVDPWIVLKNLTSYLNKDGLVLISTPNVQHFRIFLNLIKGKWEYKEAGVLDKTHLRFFTKKSLIELLSIADLEITDIIYKMGSLTSFLNKITFRIFQGFLTYQYLILAQTKQKT